MNALSPGWSLALALLCVGVSPAIAADAKGDPQPAATPPSLSGPERELARDDGTSAGKRSVAGSGHAVRFEAPGADYCLKAIRIYGSRYGHPTPPNENAYVWLCDADCKRLATFPVPYSTFQRGEPRWVTIPLNATRVPQKFVVCIGFNPTATKGVFLHYDSASSGDSLLALPGQAGKPFDKGDWLLRAVVQQTKP